MLAVALALLASDGAAGFTTRRVAERAKTSTPAVYELFGDKAGLIRELFFEGFSRLRARLVALELTEDPRADVEVLLVEFRDFVRQNPVLASLMFSRPFGDFDPGPDEREAGAAVREAIVGAVQRAIGAGRLTGDATDTAHVLLALAQGLAAQESAGWLGTSRQATDRRWALAVRATLDGLAPA